MKPIKQLSFIIILLLCGHWLNGQQISKEELMFLTPEWKGERFADGRPKVPDAILKRMKLVTLEEAWAVLKGDNYKHQYEDGWEMINPDSVLVGRAVTAIFVPGRPDIHRAIDDFFRDWIAVSQPGQEPREPPVIADVEFLERPAVALCHALEEAQFARVGRFDPRPSCIPVVACTHAVHCLV